MTEGFAVSREFPAGPDRVWAEWTTPAAFADWFGGAAADVPVDSVEMDVRPGGSWRATMFVGPDRRRIDWTGEYLEVDAPRRLVLTMTDDPGRDEREILTVELTALGPDRTQMRFAQRGTMTVEQYRASQSGWGEFFDRLAARVGAPPVA